MIYGTIQLLVQAIRKKVLEDLMAVQQAAVACVDYE